MLLGRDLLPFDPHAVADLCRELDAWRARLDSKGTLLRSWDGRLRRVEVADRIHASDVDRGRLAQEPPPELP
jgi:hypothetical protein